MAQMTRQQRRANERRASKPDPAVITRTSLKWIGRTKGQPFSRMKLVEIVQSKSGIPAVFHVEGYTSNKKHFIKATYQNIDWFVRGLTHEMKLSMLGAY